MRTISAHHLEVFRVVARLGSVTRAAAELGVSQPAVSAQIRDLERACEMPLFERQPRGVKLTHAGEVVLGYARRVASALGELDQALADLRGLGQGRLVLGGSTTVGEYLLPEIMGRFHHRYPGIELRLAIGNSDDTVQRVVAGDVEIGFVGVQVDHPDLACYAWREDRIVLVAAPEHPIAHRGSLLPVDLPGHAWIAREPESATRRAAETYAAELGLRLRPAMELGSNEAIKRAVAACLGFALMSASAVPAETAAGHLVVVDPAGWACSRPLTVCVRRDRYLGQALRAFLREAGVQVEPEPFVCPVVAELSP